MVGQWLDLKDSLDGKCCPVSLGLGLNNIL